MIYFVRSGRRRLVKIGYSKGHPGARIATLQTGSAEPLELIGILEGEPRDEAEWHRRFKHLRIVGEWFRWTDELSSAARPYLLSTRRRKMEKAIRDTEDAERIAAERRAPRC